MTSKKPTPPPPPSLSTHVKDELIAAARARKDVLVARNGGYRQGYAIAQKDAEIEQLRTVIDEAHSILHMAPELNMENYDEDEVAVLNDASIAAHKVLNEVVSKTAKGFDDV